MKWINEKHEIAGLIMVLASALAGAYQYVDGYTFAALVFAGCILFVGVGYFRGMRISRTGIEFGDGEDES